MASLPPSPHPVLTYLPLPSLLGHRHHTLCLMLILSVAWFACVMGHLGFCAHGTSWATHGGAPGKGRYVYYKYLLHSHVHSNVLWTSLTESNYKDKIVKKFEIAIAKHCQSVEPFWTWDPEVGLGCPEQSRSIRPPFWATAALKTAKRESS